MSRNSPTAEFYELHWCEYNEIENVDDEKKEK